MQNALLVGLSRQIALARELDVVANNIANLNTTGYKADGSLFEEYLVPAARADQTGSRVSFVRDRGTWHDMSQGAIEHTGNPLDVAIDGNGFLVVQTPRGERYTRNGALQINATGQLVTSDGDPVLGDGGPIALQPTDRQVSISHDGTISVREGTSKVEFRARQAAARHLRQCRSSCRRTAAAPSPRPPARTPQPATKAGRRARRDREIERARRRRDVAHDRNHAQPTPRSPTCCSSRAICASRRSTSSPKSRIDAEGELDPCARSTPQRPE